MFEDVNLLRWLLGVLALVLMFGSLVILLQKLQNTGRVPTKKPGRLNVTERLVIDGRRKLVLIEHDDNEHLIMLGHQTETLISSNKKSAPKKPKQKPPGAAKPQKRGEPS